jgi:type IV secretory pathway TraG/TraD family ATPase VirD4
MNIQDTLTHISEKGEEFLDEILQNLLGGKHNLSAKFGKESKLISARHDGLSITGTKFLTSKKSKEHLLCFAPSGVGKSTVFLIPSALNIAAAKKPASMIINNPSGELSKMSNYFINQGYEVYSFDPDNKEQSIYYNPLHRIKNPSDVTKVATMLVQKNGKKSSDFWDLKSIELISLLIEFLIENTSRIYQNIGNIYYLLENLAGNEDVVSGLFADKSTENQWRAYKSIIANSEKTKSNIISSAISHLSFIGKDPSLVDVTSVDSFDFSRMRSEKIVLFLNCNISNMDYYSPIFGLFFEQLFTDIFRSIPKESDNGLYLLIDELSSIPLPSLSNVIANARKYMSILGVLQSENQLFENFGQYNAKSILNNACKVYMTGLNDECDRVSKALGDYQYYEDKEKKMLRNRPLMTSSEIRTMPIDRVIVIPNGGMKPLYCKVKPFYKINHFVNAMEMELPDDYEPKPSPNFTAQYLSLDKYLLNENVESNDNLETE